MCARRGRLRSPCGPARCASNSPNPQGQRARRMCRPMARYVGQNGGAAAATANIVAAAICCHDGNFVDARPWADTVRSWWCVCLEHLVHSPSALTRDTEDLVCVSCLVSPRYHFLRFLNGMCCILSTCTTHDARADPTSRRSSSRNGCEGECELRRWLEQVRVRLIRALQPADWCGLSP